MAIQVQLPNGQIGEFPDDMPHDQIEAVLQKQFAPPKVADEDRQKAFAMIKQQHPGMPDFLIHALMPAAEYGATHPVDTNEGGATGAFLRSAIRTPLEGANNLASLIGLPVDKNAKWPGMIAEKEADKAHPFAELGGELAGFLAPGAGSMAALRSLPIWGKIAEKAAPSLLRRLPVMAAEGSAIGAAFSPEGQRGEGALTGGALGAAGAAIPSIGRGLGALKERVSSLRNLDLLKKEGVINDEQYNQAIAQEETAKDLAKMQGLSTDVGKLESELPEHQAQAQQLAKMLEKTPEVNTANMLGTPTGEELVPQAESLLKTSEQKAAEAEKNISTHLGKGLEHDTRAAKELKKMIEAKKKDIGNIYEDVTEDLKDTHVTLPRGREVKAITQDLNNAIRNGGYESSEVKKLAQELETAQSKGKDLVPGENFLAMYRSTRSLANKAMRNSRKTDIDAQDRIHWENQHKELTETADKMNDLLKQHMGEEQYNKLQEANHRWRTEITPLYKNKLYYQITKDVRLPSNIMNELRGGKEGEGYELLREMVKSNPEVLKNVVGQRYAHGPEKLQQFDEQSHEYIQQMPELKNLINEHRQELATKQLSKENLMKAKEKASAMQKEAERVRKSFEEEKNVQAKRQKSAQELADVRAKIKDYEQTIPALKERARVKNISLKKKIELENKIAKAEKDKESLIKYAKNLGYLGTGVALGTGGVSYLSRK